MITTRFGFLPCVWTVEWTDLNLPVLLLLSPPEPGSEADFILQIAGFSPGFRPPGSQ